MGSGKWDEKKKWQGESGKDWDWRSEELRPILFFTLLMAARSYTIKIFIDALDEAGNEPSREVVSFLHDLLGKLLELNATTSICFSCRHFPVFATAGGSEICLENENQGDIEIFVRAELERHLQTSDHEIMRSLCEDISRQASGMFLWASLMVPIVTNKYNAGKSLDHVYQILNRTPKDLDSFYRHILTEVVDVEDREATLLMM